MHQNPGMTQSFSSMGQLKQLILAPGYITDQGTIDLSSYFYDTPHTAASILSTIPSTFSDHFTTTMVYIPPSGFWILIFLPLE